MAKKTSKTIKQMTLSEFKAWLEGIEEVQPSGWHPTIDQWKLIRDRISNIKVEPRVEYAQSNVSHNPNTPYVPQQPRMQQSLLDQVNIDNTKLAVEPFVPKVPVDVLGRPIQPGKIGGMLPTDHGTLKTPDIQTSTYFTSFE